jgi:antitoxin ParD1/3/4
VKPKKSPTIQEQYEEKLAALRAAIDEGDASGLAKGDVFARVRKVLGLPPRPRRRRL